MYDKLYNSMAKAYVAMGDAKSIVRKLERGAPEPIYDDNTTESPALAARLKTGDYVVRVAVSRADGRPIAYREFPVQVVPALRRDNFVISTWHGGLTAAELQYRRFSQSLCSSK